MEKFTSFDKKFMLEALVEANKAFVQGEVPVGAVLVCGGEIISRGHNLVETHQDATLHAEVVCFRNAANIQKNWRLENAVLYVTLEPCCMCAGAAILSRVSKIVWGCADLRHGACGSWVDLFSKNHPIHNITVLSGLFEEESRELLQRFFRNRREEKRATIK